MESDIIRINKKCKKCGGNMMIERCSENGFRWKNIYCENWCWQITTPKKQMIEKHESAHFRNINGKCYLSVNGDEFRECGLQTFKNGALKVVRFGPKLNWPLGGRL